ncbi:hypothetical protein PR003_g17991 [Phytophthora rubi]|uniref:RxLR effector protein n=1 Tax=Phytophthora rubi TaxID=129364 RepID=A0A6A4EI43_9STRA|nr:hypothetical protein PR003_g17991 [Phytophthora rubi]
MPKLTKPAHTSPQFLNFPFENAAGNGKRLLRTVATVNEVGNEERSLTTPLLARLPGTTQNTARKAEKEAMKIKSFRVDYAIWMKNDKKAIDVYTSCINAGYKHKKTMKIAFRYLKYQENPALYH